MSFMYTALVMASVARWSRRAAISSGCSTSRQLFMPIRTLFQTTGSVRRLLALVYTGPITSCYFRPFGAHDKDHQPVTRDFYQERQLYSEGLKCVCQLAGGTDDPLPSAVFMSRTVSNWCDAARKMWYEGNMRRSISTEVWQQIKAGYAAGIGLREIADKMAMLS